jgi:threonine/homoserine/homoserine lactone efflux protein
MDAGTGMVGTVLVLVVVGIVLTICWIILPFAVIGTKPLLRQLLAEQRRTNELLQAVAERSQQVPTLRADAPGALRPPGGR